MNKYKILYDFEQCYVHICDILGDKTTNNIQLFKLGKKLFGDVFKDVYCSDDDIRLSNGQCCIINTDPHGKPGLHWIGLYKHRNVYYVFDSFGRNIHKLSEFFRHKKWEEVEHNRVESYKSSNCGELSMTFLVIFHKYKLKCVGVI